MSQQSETFLKRWLIDTLAVLVAAHVVSGINYTTIGGLLVASLLLGILNAFLRPFLLLLTLPLLILSLGLFALIINALLLSLVAWLVDSFEVRSFWAAFWGGLVISLISMIGNSMLGTNKPRLKVREQPAPGRSDSGRGPIIDV